ALRVRLARADVAGVRRAVHVEEIQHERALLIDHGGVEILVLVLQRAEQAARIRSAVEDIVGVLEGARGAVEDLLEVRRSCGLRLWGNIEYKAVRGEVE